MGEPTSASRTSGGQLPAWLLSSAGASALLVAFGYLVEAARDHLLGTALRENTAVAEYGFVGAKFVVNVITLGFRWIGIHPIVTGAIVVAATGVAFFVARRSIPRLSPRGTFLCFASILMLLLVKAAFLDVPAALIDNALIERTDANRTFDAAPVLNWRTQSLWRTVICAHATKTKEGGVPCGSRRDTQREDAQRKLEGLFLFNVLATVLLLGITLNLGVDAPEEGHEHWRRATVTARSVTWFALTVAIIALPYFYGKLVASTTFSEVIVHFNADRSEPESPPPPATSTAPQTSGNALVNPALLLTGSESVLTLYYPQEDLVRELSRDDIDNIKLYPARDVLQIHMDQCLAKAGAK